MGKRFVGEFGEPFQHGLLAFYDTTFHFLDQGKFYFYSLPTFLMKISKRSLMIASMITVFGAGALGVGAVFAQGTPGHTGFMSGIVTAIAQKFNLDPAVVQAVVDAQRAASQAQHEAQAQAQLKTKLAQAVQAGTLTQAQSDLITAKQLEIKSFQDSLQGKSNADRQAAMKTEMSALTQWAKTNNIPSQFIMFGRGGEGFHGGMGGGNSKAMLDQAVKDGKLTQPQEDLIVAKQAEIKTFMQSLSGKSAADRQTAVTTEMASVTAWAQTNNIPAQYVTSFGGGRGRRGGMGGGNEGSESGSVQGG